MSISGTLTSVISVLCVAVFLEGCASSAPVIQQQKVSTVEAALLQPHMPPTDFEMTIADAAPRPTQVAAQEPTKLRPMSLTRRSRD